MRDHDHYADADIREILMRIKTIAVLGVSANPARPSHKVARFLASHGYGVWAVNPILRPLAVPGLRVCGRLSDLPEPVDMIDVFRNTDAIEGIVDEVLALDWRPSVIWMQLGVRVDAAAKRAEAAGIDVIMDRCPKIEIARPIAPERGFGGAR